MSSPTPESNSKHFSCLLDNYGSRIVGYLDILPSLMCFVGFEKEQLACGWMREPWNGRAESLKGFQLAVSTSLRLFTLAITTCEMFSSSPGFICVFMSVEISVFMCNHVCLYSVGVFMSAFKCVLLLVSAAAAARRFPVRDKQRMSN